MDERDPRIIRTRASVLRAATDLLVEGGPSAVTMDAIVARSGVAKSTIYRHWQSRDDVLVEVFAECAPNIEAPSPDVAFEPALRDLMGSIVSFLHDPEWARIVPALLMLKTHADGVADLEKRLEKNQSDAITEILRRGITEGTIAPDLDVDVATAQLVGPLLFAQLTGSTPLDHALADSTVDNFLAAHGAASRSRRVAVSRSADTRKLLNVLERDGVLLVHDKVLPSATSIIAGEPVTGSWWSHPLANDIFDALQPLEQCSTRVKLIAEKETFVHERLWPELVSIGAARSRWQQEDLTSDARGLLASISRARLPKPAKDLAPTMESKARLHAVRLLEVRLLVHSDEHHTETGAHAKFLQTWRSFAREHDVERLAGVARACASFEEVVREWPRATSKPLLPWPAVADQP